jgi:hypothetical protein
VIKQIPKNIQKIFQILSRNNVSEKEKALKRALKFVSSFFGNSKGMKIPGKNPIY